MNRCLTIPVLMLLLLLAGCSTEKNTLVTRSYHNLTSRYNIFFNGNESFKKGIRRMHDSHEDDFTRILPVFIYGDPAAASSIAPDMQTTIQKATKVITLHSITVKPEVEDGPLSEKQKEFYERNEYNKYVPENYLLMGKAYLYKHDFHLAVETFKHILSEYHYDDIVYETQLWLARTYNELGEYEEAGDILEVLTGSTEFPEKLETELYATLADHYMKQEDYERAINPMERAVEAVRRKPQRIRYTFILAQLYQEAEMPEKASRCYRQVIKMNPPYAFSFSAKINRASVYTAGSEGSKQIRDELSKMLRDEKNNDFQDQIYYALGDVNFREGNVDEALNYYKLSSETSVSNNRQKATSCLTIADIYYERQDYEQADMYYDSAKNFITETHPGYEAILQKTSSLSELVKNLQVIHLEDSLQKLARMDEASRLAVIDSIIAGKQRAEQLAREQEMIAMQDQQYNRMALNERQRSGFGENQGGSWYFYNQAAKGFGQPEFRMKWGNRKLEDNWRRSNKREISFGEAEELANDTSSIATDQMKILSEQSREFYLQYIPLTDSMMDISDARIIEALFNAATLYKDDLRDYPKSVDTYQELIDRYPGNNYTLSTYYNLYSLYNELNDQQMASLFKESIIREYPESQPAMLLSNPDYAEEMMAEANAVNRYYEQTYRHYQDGLYEQVITEVDTALSRFQGDPLIPKFRLLKVLSLGRTRDIMIFTRELDSLAKSTPDPEVADLANGILAYILASDEGVKTETQKMEAEEIYRADSTGEFFYGMILDSPVEINQLKFEFINFNLDEHPNKTFDVVHQVLDNSDIVLFVKGFDDPDKAWEYLDKTGKNELISGVLEGVEHKTMIISAANADMLIQDGDPDKYWLFFQKHYTR